MFSNQDKQIKRSILRNPGTMLKFSKKEIHSSNKYTRKNTCIKISLIVFHGTTNILCELKKNPVGWVATFPEETVEEGKKGKASHRPGFLDMISVQWQQNGQ